MYQGRATLKNFINGIYKNGDILITLTCSNSKTYAENRR